MPIIAAELLEEIHRAVCRELGNAETAKALHRLVHDDHLFVEEYAEGNASLSIAITSTAAKDILLVHSIITECDNSSAVLQLGAKTFTIGQGTVQTSNLMLRLNPSDVRKLTATGSTPGLMRLHITGKILQTPIATP